jgi:hypothetical protein
MIISSMCNRLDDIADLVGECVEDDEKAGLLMESIGAALDSMADFSRGESEPGQERLLADFVALHERRKTGGDNRAAQYAAERDARWRIKGEKMWRQRYANLAPDDPNRITATGLAACIQDDIAGDIELDTIKKQIGKWNKRDGIKPNKNRCR